jgi:hypothetical protein
MPNGNNKQTSKSENPPIWTAYPALWTELVSIKARSVSKGNAFKLSFALRAIFTPIAKSQSFHFYRPEMAKMGCLVKLGKNYLPLSTCEK